MKCTKEYRLGFTEKAKSILKNLTLEEKVYLMSGRMSLAQEMENIKTDPDNLHYNYVPYPAGGIERVGVPPMLFCDGPRGVVCGNGKTTCFPVSMLRGASFDVLLEEKIGHAIGKEIKAFGGNLFGGVCINLPYNPGWGRSQETYGEESYHLGQMGAALVRGVQEEDIIACVKHYAFNQMENSRFKVSVECDKRTEREVYLPHFKECIDAGAASVMSSYNLYHGTHCGHHDYLLNEVLKKEWDFDGFVMSDFYWGVKDTVEAANGGQDMEMAHTVFFGDKLVQAVKDGKVSEEKIDESALRIIRTLLAFTSQQDTQCNSSVLASKEHIALALESARKGITLLKNEKQILPLDKKKVKKILVLGALGEAEPIGDHGSSWVRPPYVISPVQGLSMAAPDTEVIFDKGEDLDRAKALAKEADAVVFVVGYDYNDEGEFVSAEEAEGYTGSMGGDRKYSLGLHQNEIELIKSVGPVNDCSTAVLIGGNTIMITEWMDSVGAIIMAYYPGMEGGRALGEIIFGDISPSGKLPYVLPYQESDLPQVDWETTKQHYDYYHGYAKLEKEGVKPLLPYGFGLSYTTFEVSDATFKAEGNQVYASCKLKNTGNREGAEVVQMYVGFSKSSIDRPVKLLRGFTRVNLVPGEEMIVTLSCPTEKLCYYNEETNQMELEAMEYEVYIGTSSDNKDLIKGSVKL
ncbi:glycoside hydrolase family 3 C-terminal domain-containing protein [Mobilitalea sibirica]|uniref:Glycoside hydrolase family 3 C-terminal domain-containing protein n=1 Tax=Mobilitalea sibirica TaxID=1462919 RepID=A0A8J7H057_9FIRM|nr:glycoside hydrolase family 3 C-terminal domain-containing protein [Mobilitalea sibirica]MBH1939328.1 glycoside hydrolase family 3 C-terminal domain-containing protein [Mobilitalea sibirica]